MCRLVHIIVYVLAVILYFVNWMIAMPMQCPQLETGGVISWVRDDLRAL